MFGKMLSYEIDSRLRTNLREMGLCLRDPCCDDRCRCKWSPGG